MTESTEDFVEINIYIEGVVNYTVSQPTKAKTKKAALIHTAFLAESLLKCRPSDVELAETIVTEEDLSA